jgi:hypothetical protein
MKKKSKTLVSLAVLMFLISSCVYSLFPIYTEDTIVYLPELLGKWKAGEDPDDYILFEKMNTDEVENIVVIDNEDEVYTDSIFGDGWKIRTNGPITMKVNGRLITDQDSIQSRYDAIMQKIASPEKRKETELMFGKEDSNGRETKVQTFGKADQGSLTKLLDGAKDFVNKASFDGSYQITRDETYKMIVIDDDERLVYQAHVVRIGDDMFLDLYPLAEYADSAFGQNMFPVHTFMKIKLNENKLDLTQFDLDKLNKLFKSNLIRLRNENVDGTILITAQPKELQKFLDKYSDDESVFEEAETYTRIIQ